MEQPKDPAAEVAELIMNELYAREPTMEPVNRASVRAACEHVMRRCFDKGTQLQQAEDRPRREQDAEYMQQAARALADQLPDGFAFLLMAAPFTETPGQPLRYVSNMSRDSAVSVVKEWMRSCGASGENYGEHLGGGE